MGTYLVVPLFRTAFGLPSSGPAARRALGALGRTLSSSYGSAPFAPRNGNGLAGLPPSRLRSSSTLGLIVRVAASRAAVADFGQAFAVDSILAACISGEVIGNSLSVRHGEQYARIRPAASQAQRFEFVAKVMAPPCSQRRRSDVGRSIHCGSLRERSTLSLVLGKIALLETAGNRTM